MFLTSTGGVLVVPTVISHYKILEKLGEGGMGVVYRAQDTRLDRIVALKFLPLHLSATPDDEARLLREAQAAAALDHPNICTIYEVNSAEVSPGAGPQAFIAMAYVEGDTLQQKIRAGPLSIESAIDITRQIADGLEAAHEKGIVHRDIKSANIMVTPKGQVKIMDFGLAKVSGQTLLTKSGVALGTAPYMAPEQARGESIDRRTDIWCLGVTMYEMLAGERPFKSDYDQAVIYAILNVDPPALTATRPEVSVELEHIVFRCLRKNPAERYQSASELRDALLGGNASPTPSGRLAVPSVTMKPGAVLEGAKRRKGNLTLYGAMAGGAAVLMAAYLYFQPFKAAPAVHEMAEAKSNSLAVMYFDNRSGEKDWDEILVDMLTRNLARYRELEVVSHQRLFDILKLLGKQGIPVIDRSVATEIAQRAHVRRMLLGSIIKIGTRIRITAELMDVESGEIIGSDQVDGTAADDLFAMVDSLTEKVRASFHLSGVGGQPLRIADVSTSSIEAYASYQNGMVHMWRWEMDRAAKDFKQATTYDSTFALAYLQWAIAKGNYGLLAANPFFDLSSMQSAVKRAKLYSAKASEREQGFIDVYLAFFDRDFASADTLAEALVGRYPNDKEASFVLSWATWAERKVDQSVRACERTLEIDPTFALGYNSLAYTYSFMGDYDKAISAIRKYRVLQPDVSNTFDSAIEIFIQAGKFDEAYDLCKETLRKDTTSLNGDMYIGYLLMFQGKPDEARESFRRWRGTTEPHMLEAFKEKLIGLTFLHEGRYREAREKFRRALEFVQNANDTLQTVLARFDMGKMATTQSNYREALDHFSSAGALCVSGNSESLRPYAIMAEFLAGLTLVQEGDHDEAGARASHIEAMIEKNHFSRSLLDFSEMLRAESYRVQGDGRMAAAALSNVTPMTKDFFPPCRVLVAAVNGLSGEIDLAIQQYNSSYNRIHSKNRYAGGDSYFYFLERSRVKYNLARLYEKRGDKAQAIENYSLALQQWKKADPDVPEVIDARARLAALK